MSEMQLHLGDCLEILPTLADNSVDAVITDIPYGTTQCSWDEVIPFEPMWEQVKRLTGVFITTASQPFTSKLVMSNLDWFKYEWIWDKHDPSGYLNVKVMPLKQHENILVFRNGKQTFNRQFTDKPLHEQRPNRRINITKYGRDDPKVFGIHESKLANDYDHTKTNPKSILTINVNGTKRNSVHPMQKPVELYEYLIKTYTNEGDTVLDIAMGSGTTGVACVQTGRNFIGIEIEPKYFEIAEKRIAEAQLQMRMPI